MKYIVSIILVFALLFLLYLILKPDHNRRVVWGMFYNTLWVTIVLGVVNYLCVSFNFWTYTNDNSVHFPIDLYFLWIVFWGIIPFYFFKGRYLFLLLPIILLIDISLMPFLEVLGLLKLSSNWLLGELFMIVAVFFPGYYWAMISILNIKRWVRVCFQIIIMTLFLFIILPHVFCIYGLMDTFSLITDPIWVQIIFMISLPAIIGVNDLLVLGKGTPFPYDNTKYLVRNGVYAYCRNPIQWTFTLLFIPLGIYYESWFFILGTVISVAYTFGISDVQEYPDMEERFGEQWKRYIQVVPRWYFQWKPQEIEQATIYFDDECKLCLEVMAWLKNKTPINLTFEPASNYRGEELTQVTYVTELGETFHSTKAIAYAFGHINLAWAFIGWFMRYPIINDFFQLIIDASGLGEKGGGSCSL